MKQKNVVNSATAGVLFMVVTLLIVGLGADNAYAIPAMLENDISWYWTADTVVASVAVGNVDGDAAVEIVTGGYHSDSTDHVAQLCVWNGDTLALENVKTWDWGSYTYIYSVAIGNVDGDAAVEIVTGGYYYDGTRYYAQLCVWTGATLALENVQTWSWTDNTFIASVAVGNVDGDAAVEIVTGGRYYDGTRDVAQLCVWDGATLALEDVRTWYWTDDTVIDSVAIGNVDADGQVEIVTGGRYYDGLRDVAQLCVWTGATLAFEDVTTWYWIDSTRIASVAIGNVDADGQIEIVTGGSYWDSTRWSAQLCVWNATTLALEDVRTWYWIGDTYLDSVAIGNVDADGQIEIVTGGRYWDGSRYVAQLCTWTGATLALEDVTIWYWTGSTGIASVAIGNVDGDPQVEIVTGGSYRDSTRWIAQLCIWGLA